MTRALPLALALAAAGCAAPGPTAERDAPPSPTAAVPIVIGESRRLASAALGEERAFHVWLPPAYADPAQAARRFPVLYVVDGGLAQDFHHVSGLAQLGSAVSMFQDLVVVGVETRERIAELTYPSSVALDVEELPRQGRSAAFRAFLVDELRPAVDALYRTSGADALIGESLAGLFIVETFLERPDAFDTCVAISPSLWWDAGGLARRAPELLAAHPDGERALYLALASEGGEMRDGVLALMEALRAAALPGLRWTFSDRPDLDHGTIYHREALEALVWAFPLPPGDPAR